MLMGDLPEGMRLLIALKTRQHAGFSTGMRTARSVLPIPACCSDPLRHNKMSQAAMILSMAAVETELLVAIGVGLLAR